MANKYCTKCGAEIPEEAKFCTQCGQPIDPDAFSNQTKRGKANNEKKVNRKAIYALLAVLGVLLLIILGSMFYSEYSEAREKRLAREKFVADSLEQVRQDSIRLAEKERQDSIENARILSLREPYLKLLDKFASKDVSGEGYYFLCDINDDDFPEIWLQVLTDEIECELLVFTNIKGEAKELFREPAGHPSHHVFHEGNNYVLMEYAHMGYQVIYKYFFDNGVLKQEEIFSLQLGPDNEEYKDVTEPVVTTYDLTDKTPIYEIN